MSRFSRFIIFIPLFLISTPSRAVLVVEGDPSFRQLVDRELQLMRDGKRGVVCQKLVEQLDTASPQTIIRPITKDESTWHPNDRKGTRSYVVAGDTKVRGGQRDTPTEAVIYLHPQRVDPSLSLYKLGTMVYSLASAKDLNLGTFSGDFKIREKRAVFYRNAWCDSLHFPLINVSGRTQTMEYQKAKEKGLISPENQELFPILSTTNESAEGEE